MSDALTPPASVPESPAPTPSPRRWDSCPTPRWSSVGLGVLIALGWIAGCSAAPPDRAASGYELANGRWFDGAAFADARFYVVDRTLTTRRPARVDSVVDLGGGFVVPPLGEAHSHRPAIPAFAQDGIDDFMAAGIFYVMNHGSLSRYRATFAELTGHPGSVDVAFANALLASPQSHGVELWQRLLARGAFEDVGEEDLDGDAYLIVESPEDVEARWPELEALQPDFVKIMVEYSEAYDRRRDDPAFFGQSGLDPALVPLIVAKARASGLRVAAHIDTAADFAVVVDAGVDIVAHLPGYDIAPDEPLDRFRIDPADAARAARRGVTVITTTMLSVDRAGDDDDKLRRMREVQQYNLRVLSEAGVAVALGTDQFSTDAVDELLNLASLGVFDAAALLRMACEVTPQLIFPDRRIGRLADGAEASFLVLERDPLADLRAVRDIRLAVKEGVRVAGG